MGLWRPSPLCPDVLNRTVYTVTANGTVYALDAATGALQWRVKLRTAVGASLAVADGAVYVPGEPGELYALNAATGSQLWDFSTDSSIQSSPAVADGRVYIGSDNDYEYAFARPGS